MLGARSTLARSATAASSAKHERLRPVSFFPQIMLLPDNILVSVWGIDAEKGLRSCGFRVLGARSTLARSATSAVSAKHERLRPVSFLGVSILASL